MIMQTASLLNRVGNLNFDVSYKVSFKFVRFKHGFNASQPEPVGEERVGGQVSLLHNFKTFYEVYNMAQNVFLFTMPKLISLST